MCTKNHKPTTVRIALALMLLAGVFGVIPARASAETNQAVSSAGFLHEDGTLKLDGSVPASFQADSWNVQLDPARGPVFSLKDHETLSPLETATIGNWSALGSNADGRTAQ